MTSIEIQTQDFLRVLAAKGMASRLNKFYVILPTSDLYKRSIVVKNLALTLIFQSK